jgi:hypothetical protein
MTARSGSTGLLAAVCAGPKVAAKARALAADVPEIVRESAWEQKKKVRGTVALPRAHDSRSKLCNAE